MNKEHLLDLANKYGSPLYVYDTDIIASQYRRITDAFEKVEQLQLNYAVKALSNINILRFFQKSWSWSRHCVYSRSKLGFICWSSS
jgi:diaminopimelate decarboxylase